MNTVRRHLHVIHPVDEGEHLEMDIPHRAPVLSLVLTTFVILLVAGAGWYLLEGVKR